MQVEDPSLKDIGQWQLLSASNSVQLSLSPHLISYVHVAVTEVSANAGLNSPHPIHWFTHWFQVFLSHTKVKCLPAWNFVLGPNYSNSLCVIVYHVTMCEAIFKASWVMSILSCAALTQLQMHCFLLPPGKSASLRASWHLRWLKLFYRLLRRQRDSSGKWFCNICFFLFSHYQVDANIAWVCVSDRSGCVCVFIVWICWCGSRKT